MKNQQRNFWFFLPDLDIANRIYKVIFFVRFNGTFVSTSRLIMIYF